MNLYGSICLTDIPKELIYTSERNGKKYLNVEVNERREPGKYGDTHYIRCTTKTEQRREGANYYIAALKPSKYQGAAPSSAQLTTPAPAITTNDHDDDVPF